MAEAHRFPTSQSENISPGERVARAGLIAPAFFSRYSQGGVESIPAAKQILTGEDRLFRLGLVKNLDEVKAIDATKALANLALFDLDTDVRIAALEALRERPKRDYQDMVVKALRYPWLPVVQHAAQAAVTLELQSAIPEIVPLLDAPDPRVPFGVREGEGKPKQMIRELVRVNHHRNCMLCHAPVETAERDRTFLRDLPVGRLFPVRSPCRRARRRSTIRRTAWRPFVRADITYLRQDFSVQQHVEDSGKWPEMQRFDFLVRTRKLGAAEVAKLPPPPAVSEYKDAILIALRGLTGRDGPPRAQ